MGQIVISRGPRVPPPAPPGGELALEAPPELPRDAQEGLWMQLLPVLGMGGSVVFFFHEGAPPFMRVMGMVMLASTLAMVVATIVRFRRGARGDVGLQRDDYLGYLARTRAVVRETARLQRDGQHHVHPCPSQLWALVAEGTRVWERRPGDGDFAQVRIGLGAQRLATPLVVPGDAPPERLDPLCARALKRFVAAHGTVPRLPATLPLRAVYHLTLSGEPEAVYGSARAVVCSLTALHSPGDLVLAVAADGRGAERWEWVKWLPHAQLPEREDGAGSVRLVGRDVDGPDGLTRLLDGRLEGRPAFDAAGPPVTDRPHVVLVLDGAGVPQDSPLASPGGLQGVTVLELVTGGAGAPRGGLTAVVGRDTMRVDSPEGVVWEGEPDLLAPEQAEALARRLAPLRTGSGGDGEPLLAEVPFTGLLGVGDPTRLDPGTAWRPRPDEARLRVPIGVGEDGQPVLLDLKESAQGGMGPHGLCVGATGSGKSELLRTLVLGLAVTHSSRELNFVLADFKGGATFAGMAGLPHVAAVITNLADDLTLVDRMGDAVRGELNRRQELLRDAGNLASVHEYGRARREGVPLPPLPTLVVVIDEFSELLTAKPEFVDMFLQIGRIGRSLGVHLLLASQRLEEGRLRGLETYLSYRIGLRTFSAAESRAALGVPDAFHLPSVPGAGYLAHGTDRLTRFKAAYVSGPHTAGHRPARVRRAALFTAAPVAVPDVPAVPAVPAQRESPPEEGPAARSVLDVLVGRLAGRGPAAHRVWLPPLDEPPPLDALLGEDREPLVVPVGWVDRPFEQRRDPLVLDLSGAGGHLLLTGGPRSGKSTLLRTLVASLALSHSPRDAQVYALDFGGGGLAALDGLPHVGGVASRLEPERVRRTVAEVYGILAAREALFAAHGVDSLTTWRRRRARGDFADDPHGEVFLVVDGYGAFRGAHEELDAVVTDLAARGLGYGVHVVLTAARGLDVRAALKDHVTNRLELRLGDPMDSDLDRRVAAAVPAGSPGRGQTPQGLHFLSALPRADGVHAAAGLTEATGALCREAAVRWREAGRAPAVRLLPRELPAAELPRGDAEPERGLAVGLDENALRPVFVDFGADPFLLVHGEGGSGKTALLRLLAHRISERYAPDEAKIVVGDYRRTLLGDVPVSHLVEYAATPQALAVHAQALADLMVRRTPPEDVTPEQLRTRSWWSGPRIFLLVDDYELVAGSAGNPLADHLTAHLPFARDTGVHVVVACGAAGAARTRYEPFTQALRELGAQGVVLSGDPGEGEVMGTVRARPQPPGRGFLVSRRHGTPLVQLGWLPGR